MAFILPNQAVVLNAYAALIGQTPGNAALNDHVNYVAANSKAGYANMLKAYFANVSNDDLAASVLSNLGLSGFTLSTAVAALNSAGDNRIGVILDFAEAVRTYAGPDAAMTAVATKYSAAIDASYVYSQSGANVAGTTLASLNAVTTVHELTTGFDNLTGSGAKDTFNAYIRDNANTLQSGDKIDGGAEADTLFADIGNSQKFAITPHTTNVETVAIRAQAISTDTTDNNTSKTNEVQIDAQRMQGVTTWENTNSRADLLIEDVRIQDSQITKDITIVMRETDPGHVDYGVYFDQNSLRSVKSKSSTVVLEAMDTRAVLDGRPPLDKMVIEGFGFNAVYTAADGTTTSNFIELKSAAVQAAKTYVELKDALQAAADAKFGAGVVAVAVGKDFTATDTKSDVQVKGQQITMTVAGAFTFDVASSANGTPGWLKSGTVPADSGEHTSFGTGASSSTDLVTSTIILDDVGRGSTGGDLVVGGLSVGDTSTSQGVQRFEITVEDNSKLQTINSTNNTLREVTIVSGNTTRVDNAYNENEKNAGSLTVRGTEGAEVDINIALPGTESVKGGDQHNGFGFSDVRLIDASTFKGKLNFNAEITEASITKYVNKLDTDGNPLADVASDGKVGMGANFAYTGGVNNDTMEITIDSAVAASQTLTGRHDFSIAINGGSGNDSIKTNIGGNQTGSWYIDQKQNANITIDGGAGNDRINTAGAGDVIINAGSGDDVVFADNTGATNAAWTINATAASVAATALNDLQTAGGASGFLYKGKLTVSFSGASGAGVGGGVTAGAADSVKTNFTNGFESEVDVPTGANYGVTQLHINQAIKNAINNDSVLKELLTAEDGPANTLIIKSKIDGSFVNNDLRISVSSPALDGLNTSEQGTVLNAYKAYAHDSSATIATAEAAQNGVGGTVARVNAVTGMTDTQLLATNGNVADNVGGDNRIDLGMGNDLVVLGTDDNSNDVLVFTGSDIGKNTVVNFTSAAASNTDYLDFSSYLNTKNSMSGSSASEKAWGITLNTDALVETNSVTVLKGAFTATQTFAGLTDTTLQSAVNSTNTAASLDYGFINQGTLNADNSYVTTAGAKNLVGGVGKAVVMVENDLNEGEYKVFELSFDGLATTNAKQDFTSAKLLGTVDFGHSLTGANALTDAHINGIKAKAGEGLTAGPVVPPVEPGGTTTATKTINAAGSTTDGGDTVKTTYTIASGTYTHTIDKFNDGDVLKLFAGAATTVVPDADNADGKQTIEFSDAVSGTTTTIILTGLSAADDAALFNLASISTVFGAGTIA